VVLDIGEALNYPTEFLTGPAHSSSAWRNDMGLLVRFITWFENLFGWAASLIMVATLSGLVKNDDV
jgi:hypothetical protein